MIVAGTAYKPAAEIEPTWGEMDQVTAVLAVPPTVAVNCWGADAVVKLTLAGAAETVTTGMSVTVAVPVTAELAALVAVTVTVC